ncbi:hypothetical protein ADK38_34215 [Streptomyces varsoviensis]|uniref:Uncharacterized protein n=2 Tax=Streptomyces varsoviensis TaxID=67373 RepID=A0ABR5IXJ9_9ACTN|nr:hypothetical protein ADK38_34215 [Streptomyces varsoviensis]
MPMSAGLIRTVLMSPLGTWPVSGVRSTRTLKAIRSMRSGLRPYRARGVRAAAELDERARLFLVAQPN